MIGKDRRIDLFFVLVIGFVWLWLFNAWYIFTPNFYFFTNDTIQFFFPEHLFFVHHLKLGEFALRNPFIGLGEFFPPRMLTAPFSPIILISDLLFSERTSFALNSTIFPLIAGLGVFFFCKGLGLHRPSSFLSAITYMGSGFLLMQTYHTTFMHPVCLFPWMMLFLNRFLCQKGLVDFLGLILVTALMLVGGYPQFIFYNVIFAFFYSLFTRTESGWKPFRMLVVLVVALEIGFALGGVQILSSVSLLGKSDRGRAFIADSIINWDCLFLGLPKLSQIAYFLSPVPITTGLLASLGRHVDFLTPGLFSLSPFGLLIVIGVFLNGIKFKDPWFEKRAFPFLAVFIVMWLLYPLLPAVRFLQIFHYPIRIVVAGNFALVVLLGFSVQLLVKHFISKPWMEKVVVVVLVIATLGYQYRFKMDEFKVNMSVSTPEYRSGSPVRYDDVLPDSKIIDFLRSERGPFRIAPFRRNPETGYDLGYHHARPAGDLSGVLSRNLVPLAVAQAYDIWSIGHYDPGYHHPLSSARQTDKIDEVYYHLFIEKYHPFLDLFNVRFILSGTELHLPNLKLVKKEVLDAGRNSMRLIEDAPFYLYENTSVFPRAYFAPESKSQFPSPSIDPGVRIVQYKMNSIELEVTNDCSRDLVISEYADPNWDIFKNGRSVTWSTAFDALVRLEGPFKTGDRILLAYRPRILFIALGLFLFGLLQVAAVILFRGNIERFWKND